MDAGCGRPTSNGVMAYRFKLKEPLRDGFQRIAREQLAEACGRLEPGGDVHVDVHEARKALKRLRALLRLVRPAIGERDFKREDRRYRDIGRSLSGARDIAAMLECLTLLEAHIGRMGHNSVGGVLRSRFTERRADVAASLNGHGGKLALRALAKARKRLDSLRPEGKGFRAVRGGLACSYGEGRSLARTVWDGGDAEELHELRKRVQQHWRHMQLLTQAWPEVMQARVRAARELSEILGHDHDLAMLGGHARALGRGLGSKAAVGEFERLCARRREDLRALAMPRSLRLFAEPAESFTDRIGRYWRTTARIEPFEQPDADPHA
jgi:CHAD domain-containing protein